jgi:hypothetical protein
MRRASRSSWLFRLGATPLAYPHRHQARAHLGR